MARAGYPISARQALRDTKGLGLLELLIAVVLFTTAMLIGGRSIVDMVHQVSVSEVRAQAAQFAMQEMERVRLQPFADIASIATAPVPTAPKYSRSVKVAIVGNDPSALYGYRLITVTVQPPAGLKPVKVSTAVAE